MAIADCSAFATGSELCIDDLVLAPRTYEYTTKTIDHVGNYGASVIADVLRRPMLQSNALE